MKESKWKSRIDHFWIQNEQMESLEINQNMERKTYVSLKKTA